LTHHLNQQDKLVGGLRVDDWNARTAAPPP
jgi:hypothetical protein